MRFSTESIILGLAIFALPALSAPVPNQPGAQDEQTGRESSKITTKRPTPQISSTGPVDASLRPGDQGQGIPNRGPPGPPSGPRRSSGVVRIRGSNSDHDSDLARRAPKESLSNKVGQFATKFAHLGDSVSTTLDAGTQMVDSGKQLKSTLQAGSSGSVDPYAPQPGNIMLRIRRSNTDHDSDLASRGLGSWLSTKASKLKDKIFKPKPTTPVTSQVTSGPIDGSDGSYDGSSGDVDPYAQ